MLPFGNHGRTACGCWSVPELRGGLASERRADHLPASASWEEALSHGRPRSLARL